MAGPTQSFYEQHASEGLTVVTALKVPHPNELQAWQEAFGVTHHLVDDGDKAIWEAYRDGDRRPQFAVVDRNFDFIYVGSGSSGHDEAERVVLDNL